MNYEEFIVTIQNALKQKLEGGHAEVEQKTIVKANDVRRTGICIREEGKAAAPTFYLEDFYEWHKNGAGIEDVVDKILGIWEEYRYELPETVLELTDFEAARDLITCGVLNTEANREYLQEVPHIEYLDLSMVFYCTVITGQHGQVYSTKITNDLMSEWGQDIETIHALAEENTVHMLGIYLKEVEELVMDLYRDATGREKDGIYQSMQDENRIPLYILSNRPKNHGAVNMFLGGILKDISEILEADLYVIPSSVHEVLLAPKDERLDEEGINRMIREVNRNMLRPQDILSDHVYTYNREQNKIIL